MVCRYVMWFVSKYAVIMQRNDCRYVMWFVSNVCLCGVCLCQSMQSLCSEMVADMLCGLNQICSQMCVVCVKIGCRYVVPFVSKYAVIMPRNGLPICCVVCVKCAPICCVVCVKIGCRFVVQFVSKYAAYWLSTRCVLCDSFL